MSRSRGSARCDVPAQAAEGLAGNTQIGRDHMLWHPLDALRVQLHELEVFLFSRFAERFHEPALGGNKAVLYQDAKISFQDGELFQERLPGWPVDQQELAVLQRLDIEKRRLFRKKAVQIRRPPAFQGELKDMLRAFLVDGIAS